MFSKADVDIDLKPGTQVPFNWTPASMVNRGELKQHPVGFHPQNIPTFNGLAAIPFKEAEDMGYFKVDFLSNTLYANCASRQQVEELANEEPDWSLLERQEVQDKLFQLNGHSDLINAVKPRSIHDLADMIALIRPGKSHLIKPYLNDKQGVRKVLFAKDKDGYTYKKSSAYAYATGIVLQLNLMRRDASQAI